MLIYASGRKKKRKGVTKADLEAEANFVKLTAKWDKLYGPLTKAKRQTSMPTFPVPVGRETKRYPSRETLGDSTALRSPIFYSGNKMLGVSTLHKSNSVPVFSTEEIVDIARMRR
jgi:hypothetical protein